MVRAAVELDFALAGLLPEDLRVGGLDLGPRDEDPAPVAFETDAGRIARFHEETDAVGVVRLGLEGRVDIEQIPIRKLSLGLDLDRTCIIRCVTPLGDVVHMRAPAGDHAPAVGLDLKPSRPVIADLRMDPVLRERRFRGGAEPKVIIEVFRDGHRPRIARALIQGKPGANCVQLSDPLIPGQLAGHEKIYGRALLRARLEYPVVPAHGLDDLAAFGDRIGQRLLQEDVFAGVGGGDGNRRVPMVGSDDEDPVDVLAAQQLAEIGIGVAALVAFVGQLLGIDHVHQPLGVLAPVGIDVAHGHDPRPRFKAAINELLHISPALPADADAPQLHRIAGDRLSEQHPRRDDRRCDRRGRGSLKKISARDTHPLI